MRYDFSFGGTWISELGAMVSERTELEIAQREGELIKIQGKDGDDYIDYGSYKNVDMSRPVSMISKHGISAEQKAQNFIYEYAYLQGYQLYEDTDHPDLVTEAVLQNFDEVNKEMRSMYSTTLKFSRKPFWFLKSGLEYKAVDLSPETPIVTFNNPYKVESKPIIKILATGGSPTAVTYKLTVGGTETTYTAGINGNSITIIDCEKQTIKVGTSYGNFEVPKGFGIGENTFKLTAGKSRITSIEISPRWRCL